MISIEPSSDPAIRRTAAWRLAARAAAVGVVIGVCLLPAPSAAAGAGARDGLVMAAQPTTPPGVTADEDSSQVSFRIVRDAEQPLPPPPTRPPPMPGTGLDLPVVALVAGAAALIALGALLIAFGSANGRRRNFRRRPVLIGLCAAVVMVVVVEPPDAVAQATRVPLGTTESFAVLAATTVTSAGVSVITGDLGVSPGGAITGFPPGTVSGTIHLADSVAAQAHSDLAVAYGDAALRTATGLISDELGSTTRTAGVYESAAGTFGIAGTLTLDAQGNPNAVFIFKAVSTLITVAGSAVTLVNGARASNVYWQVGSSATLGATSVLRGTVLAQTSITATAGAVVDGRLLALDGAVTLDNNTVTATSRSTLLSITGPETANLGTVVPGSTVGGQLGPVTVDAEETVSWTATVSTTVFARTGGGASVPAEVVSYWSGPFTTQVGVGTPTPGQETAPEAQDLSEPRTAFDLASGAEVTAITWNPTLIVAVPISTVMGTYTATVTHSVA